MQLPHIDTINQQVWSCSQVVWRSFNIHSLSVECICYGKNFPSWVVSHFQDFKDFVINLRCFLGFGQIRKTTTAVFRENLDIVSWGMSLSTETKTESNRVALWILFCFKDTTINATIRDVTSHLATFHLSFIALLSNILIYRYLTDQIHLFPVRFNCIQCIIMNLSSFSITK